MTEELNLPRSGLLEQSAQAVSLCSRLKAVVKKQQYFWENMVNRQKAAEIIGYSKQRAKAIGCMIWPCMLVVGFVGWYLWKWYALPMSLVVAYVFGSIYSMVEGKRIQEITGLDIHEQENAYRQSAAASLDPITRDPEQYRSYIDSLPDNGTEDTK